MFYRIFPEKTTACSLAIGLLVLGIGPAPRPFAQEKDRETRLRLLETEAGDAVDDVARWEREKRRIRQSWLEFLGPMAKHRTKQEAVPAVSFEVLDETLHEDILRRRILYGTEPGERVEAYLLIPQEAKIEKTRKRPAAVVFHSTVPEAHRQAAGLAGEPAKAFAWQLAKKGFVTIAPKNFLWPEQGNFDPKKANEFLNRNPGSLGMARMLLDGQVAVDVLRSLEEVDSERIFALGHSLGAKEAFYLAAFDERICCAIFSEGGIGISHSNWEAPWYLGETVKSPEFSRHHAEVLSLIAPRPFLLIGGGKNVTMSSKARKGSTADTEDARAYIDAARDVYRLYDRPENLELFLHEHGHAMPPEAEQKIDRWIDKQVLKLKF